MSDTYLAVTARTDMNRYNKVRLPAPPFEIPEAQPRITRAAKVPVTGFGGDIERGPQKMHPTSDVVSLIKRRSVSLGGAVQ